MLLPDALSDRYRAERILGKGGMGAVVLARDLELDRDVAIKVALRPDDPDGVIRFRREAQAMALVRHPQVARLLDFGEVAERLYLVLEYVPGGSPSPGLPEALRRMLAVAEALEAVHRAGVLHRDIKPNNLVQRQDGELVLIDFGLARRQDDSALTETGEVVGTPYFLAPEILLGEPPSPASDFYAWGATLFALLEGRPPIPGDRIAGWALHGEHELTWEQTPVGSVERRLVKHCLAHDPRRRPTTLAQLEALRAGGTVSPDSPTLSLPRPEPLPVPTEAAAASPSPRARTPWAAPLLGLLLVSLGLAGWALARHGPSGVLRDDLPGPELTASPRLPEAEALAASRADLARLFGWGPPGEDLDPSWIRGPTARAALPALADVRLPSKLRRAAGATRDWVTAVEAQGSGGWDVPGRGERFRHQVVGGLLHAIGLHRVARNLLEGNALRVLETGTFDPAREAMQATMPELRATCDSLAKELADASKGEPGLVFEAFAAGIREEAPRPALIPELLAALRAEPPSPLRPSLASALDYLSLHVVGPERLPCTARRLAVEFRGEYFRATPTGFSLRERWRRRLRAMTLEVQFDRACAPANPKRRASHFGAYLDEIDARGSQAPELVGIALADVERSILRPHVFHGGASPWLHAALPRIRSLEGRFPTPPAEREPEE